MKLVFKILKFLGRIVVGMFIRMMMGIIISQAGLIDENIAKNFSMLGFCVTSFFGLGFFADLSLIKIAKTSLRFVLCWSIFIFCCYVLSWFNVMTYMKFIEIIKGSVVFMAVFALVLTKTDLAKLKSSIRNGEVVTYNASIKEMSVFCSQTQFNGRSNYRRSGGIGWSYYFLVNDSHGDAYEIEGSFSDQIFPEDIANKIGPIYKSGKNIDVAELLHEDQKEIIYNWRKSLLPEGRYLSILQERSDPSSIDINKDEAGFLFVSQNKKYIKYIESAEFSDPYEFNALMIIYVMLMIFPGGAFGLMALINVWDFIDHPNMNNFWAPMLSSVFIFVSWVTCFGFIMYRSSKKSY